MFKYYITDMFFGHIVGTNDEATAVSYAESEEAFVLDVSTGEWIQPDGSRRKVEEYVPEN